MFRSSRLPPPGSLNCFLLGAFLALLPALASAQSADSIPARPNIISFSPAELFYKAQIGYERQVSRRNAVGTQAFYRYGFNQRYQGWQASLLHRFFVSKTGFPTGVYFQTQISVFNFQQEAHMIDNATHQPYYFEYRSVSGGAGVGIGCRKYLMRRAFGPRLLANALLGVRAQYRPEPTYDSNLYYVEVSFLGPRDDANWHFSASGPGYLLHGLLTLDYQF